MENTVRSEKDKDHHDQSIKMTKIAKEKDGMITNSLVK